MKGNQFYLWLYILYWIVSSIAIYYFYRNRALFW